MCSFLTRSFYIAVFFNKFDDDLIKSVCISPVQLWGFSNLSSNLKRILVYNYLHINDNTGNPQNWKVYHFTAIFTFLWFLTIELFQWKQIPVKNKIEPGTRNQKTWRNKNSLCLGIFLKQKSGIYMNILTMENTCTCSMFWVDRRLLFNKYALFTLFHYMLLYFLRNFSSSDLLNCL